MDWIELSKTVSHALRHDPWAYELDLDHEGWADIGELLEIFRELRAEWSTLNVHDLIEMIAASSKRRHEIEGPRIRALYGHSLPRRLCRTAAKPPELLFHGTSPPAIGRILRQGLKPMCRHFVHLSVDLETARQVGKRKGGHPVILEVDGAGAYCNGVEFYERNENVWLAEFVPVAFIRVMQEVLHE